MSLYRTGEEGVVVREGGAQSNLKESGFMGELNLR
jgi:hypothetical protein